VTEVYEVGTFYRVPAVKVNNWHRFEGWIPVVGPMHEDAEIVHFPWQHFHVDWRFASARLWAYFKDRRAIGGHFGWPIQTPNNDGTQVILAGPEPRRMTYKRDPGAFPANITRWQKPLREKFACAKLINGTCPHRGIPVSAMHREGDILTCPGHGLKWHAITGDAVQPSGDA
jgi:hypothetical protein